MAGYTGPVTHNPLLANYYELTLDRIPNIVYFCQSVNLPGLAAGVTEQPTIFAYPVKLAVGSVSFEDFSITFKVDENLNNWKEIYNWIRETTNYNTNTNKLNYKEHWSDATLLITNSSYKPKIKVTFNKIFPIALTGIQFSSVLPESTEVSATVQFGFTDYLIENL